MANHIIELEVKGMSCANCARHVREALTEVPGVRSADVTLETGRARLTAGSETKTEALLEAVQKAGYSASLASRPPRSGWFTGWNLNVLVGTLFTLPLFAGDWFFHSEAPGYRWTALALATVVQLICGKPFYAGAWRQLKQGSSNMDTLVALGSTAAYAFSVASLLLQWPGHLYFMESAAIITLISIGHWLEARMSARAANSLRALVSLAPSQARVRRGGEWKMEALESVRPGDRILLRPGERIGTDGCAASGNSTVDESMLTGESMPVEKAPGSPLFAGTLNLSGEIEMTVTQTGEGTALAHVIVAVQRAQGSRAAIQRLGDRVSSIFVPIVIALAVATGLAWGFAFEPMQNFAAHLMPFLWHVAIPGAPLVAAVVHATAVLIIACPCAMGLATPAAIMAATNAAAQRGILIRDAVALEKAGEISKLIFDKTGTLTRGKPAVVAMAWRAADGTFRLQGPNGQSKDPVAREAVEWASRLASSSNHPLSLAVHSLAPDASMPAGTQWTEIRGKGIQAAGTNGTLRLGSMRWLRESGVSESGAESVQAGMQQGGATLLGFADSSGLRLIFALEDTLKEGAAEVVSRLRSEGIEVYLLTGDQAATARHIAAQVGIDEKSVFAEVSPEKKAEQVAQLQREGAKVAFVGDGINDAPALEQADLGIAVSKASDIARESADLILLNSEIDAVPESIQLARRTLRVIRQNLFWAFFYNAAAVPLAMIGFLSPILSAAAMGLSDVIVIGNALRLRRNIPPKATRRPPPLEIEG